MNESRERRLLYGLRVVSDLPLHVDRPTGFDGEPDLVITLAGERPAPDDEPAGRLLASYVEDDRAYFTFVTTPAGDHLLRFHRTAEFVVSADLRNVAIFLAPGADPGLAAVLVTGTLMSFILLMRGVPLLHASAVDLGGRALAFVGYAGKGKSTMATVMCAAGARIITDDVLRLDVAGSVVQAHLGATEARLRKSAVELAATFGGQPSSRPSVRKTSDDRDAVQLLAADDDLLPLAAIVVPEPRRDIDRVELVRLSASEALLQLARYPRIVGWVGRDVLAGQFQHLADIVERVPVLLGNVPWGPPFAADIAPTLLEQAGLAIEPATGALDQPEAAGSR
jgi:hypothetical protein